MRRVRDEKGYVDVVMVLVITALLLVMVGVIIVDASDRLAISQGLEPSGWRGLLPSKAFLTTMLSWGVKAIIAIVILSVAVLAVSRVRRYLNARRSVGSKAESTLSNEPVVKERWLGESFDNFEKQVEFHATMESNGERNLLNVLLEINDGLLELEKVDNDALRQELGTKYEAVIDKVSYLVGNEYWGDIIDNSRWWDNSNARLADVESGVARVRKTLTRDVQRVKGMDNTAEVSLRFFENLFPVDELKGFLGKSGEETTLEGFKESSDSPVMARWFEKLGKKVGLRG